MFISSGTLEGIGEGRSGLSGIVCRARQSIPIGPFRVSSVRASSILHPHPSTASFASILSSIINLPLHSHLHASHATNHGQALQLQTDTIHLPHQPDATPDCIPSLSSRSSSNSWTRLGDADPLNTSIPRPRMARGNQHSIFGIIFEHRIMTVCIQQHPGDMARVDAPNQHDFSVPLSSE